MGAKNKVIAGDYNNKPIVSVFGDVSIGRVVINKDTVEKYEVVDETSQKSASSAVGRGLIGAAFLGPVGLLAGLSAKSKGAHTLTIQFYDGKKSLIEVNDKIYKNIMTKLF